MQYVVKKSCSKRDKDKRQMQIKIFFFKYILPKLSFLGPFQLRILYSMRKPAMNQEQKFPFILFSVVWATFPFH